MSTASPGPSILLSTGSLFHLPLPTVAHMGADAGFDGMELIVNSPGLTPGPELEAVDAICPIRSLHAPFRDWSKWGGHLNSWKATTALANSLRHCEHITLHPPGSRIGSMIQNRWFARAHDLRLLLDAVGRVRYSLENLPWVQQSPFGRDELDKLLAQCRQKNVGLTYDVCHMGVSGRDVLASLERVPGPMLYNVHFSDALGYREHLKPGAGNLPLEQFLGMLGKRDYSGPVTLELEPAAFPDDPEAIVNQLRETRQWMKRSIQNG
ncbi:sugar phosphate isomerase/epimerase family protein [Salidesulfovibrio onnuriiensis]|uniref:sugar phosphate isomerase/epimerase family protein n=1 Tax=Salidesulfovibrio onnuriiensis TaxID=2583823 RepID=UPI0011CA698A|nr:sugar phosphate isomerase/epimerase family protein [Salidesulfovibrio onnuriiensis]